MRKLFIFDCFGVVLGEIAPVWFTARFGAERGNCLKEKYFGGGDRGEKRIEEIVAEIEKDLGISKSVIARECDKLLKVNDGVMQLIAELSKHDAVCMLTNAAAGLMDKLLEHLSLKDCFDAVFVSGEMKIAKPDPEAYLRCIRSYGEEFSAVYMIDDNPKNLAGLDKLNIVPVLFEGNGKLQAFIRSV